MLHYRCWRTPNHASTSFVLLHWQRLGIASISKNRNSLATINKLGEVGTEADVRSGKRVYHPPVIFVHLRLIVSFTIPT